MSHAIKTKLSTSAVALTLAATGVLGGTVATAGVATAADGSSASGATTQVETQASKAKLKRKADKIMKLSYGQFAKTKHIKPFVWSTNGCSAPIKHTPYRKTFTKACKQHDFGYRNYGGNYTLNLSPTRATKNKIDKNFLGEMKRACKKHYPGQKTCRTAANGYFHAVQNFGDKYFW